MAGGDREVKGVAQEVITETSYLGSFHIFLRWGGMILFSTLWGGCGGLATFARSYGSKYLYYTFLRKK